VFEVLGQPLRDEAWVRLECYGGVGKKEQIELLAGYASRPLLGDNYGEFVTVDRPITRLLVLVDPEEGWGTADKREKNRKDILRQILSTVAPEFSKDLASSEAKLVTVRTWGELPFEFAHLDAEELTDGLIEMTGGQLPTIGRARLLEMVQKEPARHKPGGDSPGGSKADIESVFRRAWPGVSFSKVRFADVMWPVLERKIRLSLADEAAPVPPLLRDVKEAIELASLPNRMNMALRRGEDPAEGHEATSNAATGSE
jgi:hypothetical protein